MNAEDILNKHLAELEAREQRERTAGARCAVAAGSAATIVAEGYYRLRVECERMREALQAIMDEACQHTEHNPVSGIDRLPAGYTRILNIADDALNPPNTELGRAERRP